MPIPQHIITGLTGNTLAHLDLQNVALNMPDLMTLNDLLRDNTSVRSMNLSNTGINMGLLIGFLASLPDQIMGRLTQLDISNNPQLNHMQAFLTQLRTRCPMLREINITATGINQAEVAQVIASHSVGNTTLRQWTLQRVAFENSNPRGPQPNLNGLPAHVQTEVTDPQTVRRGPSN